MVIYLINYYSEGGILKINEKTSTIIIAAFSQLTHQLIANIIVAALPEFKMNVLMGIIQNFSVGFYNNNNIKYIVVHTDNYIYLAELLKVPTDIEFKEFVVEYNKIRASSAPEECWNKFNNNPITKKFISVDMVSKL